MSEVTRNIAHKASILTLVILPFVGTTIAMILLWNRYFFWRDVFILLGMYIIATIGVTTGYHRMVTHQGFKAPEWLRGLFLIAGAGAFEGQPIAWVATHIVHHAYSDEEGDPHSPLDGFWHAHFGWLFSPRNFANPKHVAPHLLEDHTLVFVDRFVYIWMFLSLLLPFLLGGWTGLLWGGAVRIFLTTHITWSVNSICHTFGKRPFETTDKSRNNWIIGLIGLGEGWHNNHHAFPQSAFHGLRWWQFDLTGILIRILEWTGLIWNVERVSREMLKNMQNRLMHSANIRQKQLMAYQNETREILNRFRHQGMLSS